MKRKNYLQIAACLSSGILMLSSCGNKNATADRSIDTDSVVVAAEIPDTPFEMPPLTADSLGPVKIGMEVNRLPQDVAGLYVSFSPEVTPDAQVFLFSGEKGQILFTAYDFLEGKIDVIALNSPELAANAGGKTFHIGDSFAEVVATSGAKAEWAAMDDGGLWYWRIDGLWFGVDEEGLEAGFAQALCDGTVPPRVSTVPEDAKIGYIGTGLPF